MVCAVCPPLASRWPLLPRSTLTNIGPHYQALHQLRAKAISTIACSRHNIYQPACVTKLRLGKEQALPEKQQLQSVQASRPDSAGNRFRCSSSSVEHIVEHSVELGQLEHTVVGHGRCPPVGCDRETACGRPCNNVEVLRGNFALPDNGSVATQTNAKPEQLYGSVNQPTPLDRKSFCRLPLNLSEVAQA